MNINREGDQIRVSFEKDVEQLVAILKSNDREYIYLPEPSDLEESVYGPYNVGSQMIEQEADDFILAWPEAADEVSQMELIFRTCAGLSQNLVVDL